MTLREGLERDHAEIDRGIESFASELATGHPRIATLTDSLDELRRHIYFEEELLFPLLHEAGLVPPLFVMRREHGEIWATVDALSAALASGSDPAFLGDLVDQLTARLEAHNSKEETIVYPAAEWMIDLPTRGELAGMLASVKRPDQWVCEAAR